MLSPSPPPIFLIKKLRSGAPGGTLFFSSNVGSGPAITVLHQKYLEFQAPQKILEILATPKNIPDSVS